MAAQCASCHQPIWWAVNEATGKRSPLNVDPSPAGRIYVVDNEPDGTPVVRFLRKEMSAPVGVPLYTSHFASCPNSHQHRKTRGRR